jgi:hypothetical protein
VVYEWLCGERPFEGSVSELISQQLSMPPPALRERVPAIPAEVEQVVLRALTKDPKVRFASVADFAKALEQASQRVLASTAQLASGKPVLGSTAAPNYETVAAAPSQPVQPTVYPVSFAQNGHDTPQHGATSETPQSGQVLLPTAAVVSPPLEPTMPVQRKARRIARRSAALLIGLVVVVIAGSILGSVSLLTHFGVLGAHSGPPVIQVARGGTWTYGMPGQSRHPRRIPA